MGRSGKGQPSGSVKANLPVKVCVSCGRPFSWRKKWEKDWSQVKFCSVRCRRSKGSD
ncbi:MAG: DUF2256 domain-containing protein [Burkholderiales bacterium]|nr:DUF2256 domain-containing protein [Burkholderiales bacterium]MBL6878367.1 DUF2256 domain-containing protein [Burkholderiales bacterium]MDA9194949.1 DUF2256 domain-containing protein [Burkholderiales bacterium]HAT52326.1 DUF2256 domain-containing protein [Betaproteobacteria bacterium]